MSDCIEWSGARKDTGYGAISIEGKSYYVHRLAWEWAHGPIPPGMYVCHTCDNPPCYKVDHLFLGTPSDNVQDMVRKGRQWLMKKTHCKRGHPLAGDNLMPGPTTVRRCRTCAMEMMRLHKIRKRDEAGIKPRARRRAPWQGIEVSTPVA